MGGKSSSKEEKTSACSISHSPKIKENLGVILEGVKISHRDSLLLSFLAGLPLVNVA